MPISGFEVIPVLLSFPLGQQCTPPTIENGDVTADSFLFESVVTFTCHPG